MKKFSNLDKKEKYTKKYPSQLRKTLGRLIEENIIFQYQKEPSDLNVDKEKLINNLENYIKEHLNEQSELLLETSKHNSIHIYSLPVLNTMVDNLYDELDSLNILPEPKEVFNEDDFIIKEESIQLNNLKNIPEDNFLDNLSERDIIDYFSNENKVIIDKLDKVWRINFKPSKKYMFESTGISKNELDYKRFIKENKNFISDFVKSCQMTVGKNKLQIENINKF